MSNNRKISVNKSTYTNSTPVPQSHGGIEAGETFNGLTMQQMFDKILYPYIAPNVNLSVSTSNIYSVVNDLTFEDGNVDYIYVNIREDHTPTYSIYTVNYPFAKDKWVLRSIYKMG
jgi:hypothetical protein